MVGAANLESVSLDRDVRETISEVLDQSYLRIQNWRGFFSQTQSWAYEKKKRLQLTLLRGLAQEFDLKIETWDDFDTLPLSSKDEMRRFVPHNPETAIPHQTSGSSGIPFAFYRDPALEAIDGAIFERAWSWVGRSDGLVLRLVSGNPKWKYYDSFRNIIPMNYRTIDDRYADWMIEKKPRIIHGVAGAIRDLTDRVVRKGGARALENSIAYLMSEDSANHRKVLSRYYGGVFMGYGNAECRTVASQCSAGTLHVNMETSIVESINGELYVSNLFNKVMPFLRYPTGDKGDVVARKSCACGLVSDAIEGIQGKVIDYYYQPGMKRPTGWWLVSPISHEHADLVKAWRLEIIPSKKTIRVYVVPKSENLAGFQKYLGWVEENTGFSTELVKATELPDWRRKLMRVVDN